MFRLALGVGFHWDLYRNSIALVIQSLNPYSRKKLVFVASWRGFHLRFDDRRQISIALAIRSVNPTLQDMAHGFYLDLMIVDPFQTFN